MILEDLPLSRALADRAAHLRTDERVLGGALSDGRTRVLLVADGSVAVDGRGALAMLPAQAEPLDVGAEPGVALDDGRWLLLGQDDAGAVYLALRVAVARRAALEGVASDVLVHGSSANPATRPELPDGLRWESLRVVGADLSALEAGLATTAVALDAWHVRHPRCPRCGAVTAVTHAGWVRTCTQDASEHYPRTDPAVIMAVVDDADRILLGQAAAWASDRWSTLAGFVEPGESLEHAVRREVLEETGVVVGPVEYRGSQPWPFPASLMLGFRARAATTEVRVDGVELTRARWFTRDELRDAVSSGEVVPPGRSSIARALVEEWFGGPLGSDRPF